MAKPPKKILLLARYYPPEASGGARRPLALFEEFREQGFDIRLAAPQGADCPALIEVPHPSFPVDYGSKPIAEKWHFANYLRKALLLPDPEIRWALRLVKAVKQSGFLPDLIISTNPPESLHIAGALLKAYFGCKWVAEFRDPWIYPSQRRELAQNPVRRAIETLIAKACLKSVDGLIAVSGPVLNDAQKLAPKNSPSRIIGHFARRFDGAPVQLPKESFNIVHTGAVSLSNPLSDFIPFLAAFEAFVSKRKDAKLYLVGRLSETEISAINNSPSAKSIILMGVVSMSEARAIQAGADTLLLVSGERSHALPGKSSEYALTGKPIIAFGNGSWRSLLPQDAWIIDLSEAESLKKGQTKKTAPFDAKEAALLYGNFFESLFSD